MKIKKKITLYLEGTLCSNFSSLPSSSVSHVTQYKDIFHIALELKELSLEEKGTNIKTNIAKTMYRWSKKRD